MKDWKYKLESEGKALRKLINKEEKTIENVIAIYEQLIVCLETWEKKLSESDKDVWGYGIQTLIEDLQYACPDMESEEESEELSYKNESENLNYFLRDFYDMCDGARVLVGI